MGHSLDQRAAVASVGPAVARQGITCTQHARQSAEKHRRDACDQGSDALRWRQAINGLELVGKRISVNLIREEPPAPPIAPAIPNALPNMLVRARARNSRLSVCVCALYSLGAAVAAHGACSQT